MPRAKVLSKRMKDDASPPPAVGQNGDVDDDIKDAKIIEVRCGMLTGKMHLDKFVCPGIHQNCIEHEGQMISPKMFTVFAQKDKQKDWKGSIRIGRTNLRSLMEMKTFDFFEHEKRCSLKCQSRNYISARLNNANSTPPSATPIQRISFSSSSEAGEHNPAASTSFYASSPSAQSSLSNASTDSSAATSLKNNAVLQSVLQAYASQTVRSTDPNSLANLDLGFGAASTTSDVEEDRGGVDCDEEEPKPSSSDENLCTEVPTTSAASTLPAAALNMNNTLTILNTLVFANTGKQEMFKKLIGQSPADFWNTMKQLGLIEDLFNDLTAALSYMKQAYLNGAETSPAAAATLSRVTAAFDLEKSFSEKAHAQLVKAQLSSLMLNLRNVQTLQQQQLVPLVDRNAKRKSPCSNQLLGADVPAKQFCARNNQV
uniref:SAND domain-containing protein n=1 Tax=Steinernema glaseri TaxID=37863 RepID=A0A1I7ZK74_9BILA